MIKLQGLGDGAPVLALTSAQRDYYSRAYFARGATVGALNPSDGTLRVAFFSPDGEGIVRNVPRTEVGDASLIPLIAQFIAQVQPFAPTAVYAAMAAALGQFIATRTPEKWAAFALAFDALVLSLGVPPKTIGSSTVMSIVAVTALVAGGAWFYFKGKKHG